MRTKHPWLTRMGAVGLAVLALPSAGWSQSGPAAGRVIVEGNDSSGSVIRHEFTLEQIKAVVGTVGEVVRSKTPVNGADVLRPGPTQVGDMLFFNAGNRTLTEEKLGKGFVIEYSEDLRTLTFDAGEKGKSTAEISGLEGSLLAEYLAALIITNVYAATHPGETLSDRPDGAIIVIGGIVLVACVLLPPICSSLCWGACRSHGGVRNSHGSCSVRGWFPPRLVGECTCNCNR